MVLERMSLARVRLLHRRAADSLIRRHTREPRSAPEAVIARHLAASGQEEEAADWFWRAGTAANSLYAHREAIEHLQSALALGSDPESTHCGLGDALTKLGRYDEALIAYEQAAAAAAHGDEPALAVIEHKLAEVHERLGDWPVAQAHLESAAELLGTAGSPALRGQVLADLALVLQRQGRDESQSIAIRALDLAEESGDDVALAQAHNVLGVLASAAGDERSASEHLTSSRVHAAVSDHELEVASLNNLSRVYARAGRFDEALSCAREALVLGDHLGDQHRIAALNDHLADLLHQAGRDEDAEEYSKAAAAAFAQVAEARSRPEIWKLVSW
jgi:tetratricopeptide (TPR) repeat protein